MANKILNGNVLPTNDHDLLIKLDTKMDGLANNLKDFQTNLITRVSRVENRLDQEDIYHAKIDLTRFNTLADWVENLKSNFHLLLAIGGLVVAIIGGIIARLIFYWLHI